MGFIPQRQSGRSVLQSLIEPIRNQVSKYKRQCLWGFMQGSGMIYGFLGGPRLPWRKGLFEKHEANVAGQVRVGGRSAVEMGMWDAWSCNWSSEQIQGSAGTDSVD